LSINDKNQIDVYQLKEAFSAFNEATKELRTSYDLLKKEAGSLREDLEEKNKKLESLSSLFESVLMNSLSGIIAVDSNGVVLVKNKIIEKLYNEFYDNFFEEHIFSIKELGIYERNFGSRTLKISAGELTLGSIKGTVYVIDDITEFKQLEQEKQRDEKLKLMGEMAANIAHEIRNPLGSIELFSTLLQKEIDNDNEKDKLVRSILKGIKTINSIVSNVLMFNKNINVELKQHYVSEIVDDVIMFLRHLMIDKKINLLNKIGEDNTIYCDIEYFKQVIMNLVHNAIEAVDMGGKIVIESSEGFDETRISIWDNGHGINPDFIDKLFIPFQTTKPKGTGLGLSIVYKIIKEHKGKITPKSDGKTYTQFTLKIPKKRL